MPNEVAQKLKILVVDDDPSALFIYKTHLVRAGYAVVCASDVTQARLYLTQEGTESFGAVLTDYWMPGGTGFDLLRFVRGKDRSLAVVIVTAEGEKEHVAQSLREGAHNYLDKPLSGAMIRDATAKAVDSTRRQRQQRATVQEARALGDTQRLLLGRQTASLSGRLSLFSRPNGQAGGDFAAAFAVEAQRHVVLVSDVSGHDLTAAYCSAYLQGIARGMLNTGARIEDVFRKLNELILDEWNTGTSVDLSLSACVVDIDLRNRSLRAINCGLPIPMISDEEGFAVPLDAGSSNPLGWFDELPGVLVHPLSGGYLQFWSDGLEDAAAHLGVAPLALAFRIQTNPGAAEALLAAACNDDIVAVRLDLRAREDAPGSTRHPLYAETLSGSRATDIDTLQARFEKSLLIALPTLDGSVLGDIVLCYREALLNALRHGCEGRPDLHALVQVAYDLASRTVHLSISDDGSGHWFDHTKHEEIAASEMLTEHRGLVLVKNLSSKMHMSARGNRLSMDFPVTPQSITSSP